MLLTTVTGEWKAAGDLVPGDCVVTITGEAVVEAVEAETLSEAVPVYNLTVEGAHNYYVAKNGVLVHNWCEKDAGKQSGAGQRELKLSNNLSKANSSSSHKFV